MEEKQDMIFRISKYIPSVEKPLYKHSINEKLKWTGLALIAYLALSSITVYGIAPQTFEQFRFLEIVLGSKFGSIMTLGIGPLVTAGIILQLLVGSKILNWDTKTPAGRKKFQAWNRVLSITFALVEAVAYVLAGALGPVAASGPAITAFVIGQLALGGIIVILLDDLVTKWGFGSGISLFIVAGVSSQILVRALSPLAQSCAALQFAACVPNSANPPTGLLWNFLISFLSGNPTNALISAIPLISTVLIFLVVVYAQSIAVNVPLAYSALRGFGRTWSLKFFYTSNLPVILAAALLANFQLIGQFGLQATPDGLKCGPLGCYDAQGNARDGLAFYLSTPSNFLITLVTNGFVTAEVVRVLIHIILFAVLSMVFAMFWVNTAGMDAKSVAEQLESVGMQIPGYRRDPRIIESVLNRYIPSLTILGGLAVGILAAVADVTGAIGTGTGILLSVMIIYQLYEQLGNENLEGAHPLLRKVMGK
ncbi:preprotein translocase subunit SecY [archaeon]|nr:MAG: preprotein translocase subunit SecY [archaeon]